MTDVVLYTSLEENIMHYIYVIQNRKDLKIYIGQTKYPQRRWRQHRNSAKRCKRGIIGSSTILISRAMAKHDVDNFEFQIIEECSVDEINDAERFWISFFGTQHRRKGYNLSPGGDSPGCGPDHPNYGKPAPNRLFTYGQEQIICKRYAEEKIPITKLAKIYECHESTIHKMLQRHGVEILGNKVFSKGKHHSIDTEFQKGQEAHNKRFTIEQELTICKEYKKDKLTCPQIAQKYNCNRSIIQKLLRRYNVPIRSKAKLTDMDKIRIREEFLNSSSIKLAAKYGVNKSTILRLCK